MSILELSFASGRHGLEVRHFKVEEGMSRLFRAAVVARSPSADVDLDALVGQPALFRIGSGLAFARLGVRTWSGVCSGIEQVRVEPTGLSTYELTIVPSLWLLGQRRNNRLFQHVSIPAILERIFGEWQLDPVWKIDRDHYPRLELRVQYGESDLAFVSRLLEEAGISYYFADDAEKGSRLVLHDRPQESDARAGGPLPFVDATAQAQAAEREFLTAVRLGHEVKPGRYTFRDFDFRNPGFPLFGDNAGARVPPEEARYEQYHYQPGAALVESSQAALGEAGRVSRALAEAVRLGGTPVADDKGVARFDQAWLARGATTLAEGRRNPRRVVHLRTNALDLAPGVVFSMLDHPRLDLGVRVRLLVDSCTLEGAPGEEWHHAATARFADQPYRPPATTPKPVIHGVQSAIVVGPPGEEIHTDEFGRVRVQFHWDREGKHDDASSTWMRVSQGWAGGGYGLFTIPRIGHEVLISFLDGDPDCPIITGCVFNGLATVPHGLPDNKTVSTWKSHTSPTNGGFNELRFEDAAGREQVYLQAERDLAKLVKHDERAAVGHDRTTLVRGHDGATVGGERTRVVQGDEVHVVGMNHTTVAGMNRNSTVGVEDSTLVGSKFSVTVARGLTARLTKTLVGLFGGPLASVLQGPISAVLGAIPRMPLGRLDPTGSLLEGPLSVLGAVAPRTFHNVLDVLTGFTSEPGPDPTTFEMVDRKITFTTGEASIVLEGPNITLLADGNIMFHAKRDLGVMADDELAIAGQRRVVAVSKSGDVVIQGGPNVHINPHDKPTTTTPLEAAPAVRYIPRHPPPTCTFCGLELTTMAGSDELICPAQYALIQQDGSDAGDPGQG